MAKKKIGREDVIEALAGFAFGGANRAVELAYLERPTPQAIRRMDLSAVTEFRRNANGSVEMKFIDRVKALSALYEMLGGGAYGGEAEAFFRALEEAGEEDADTQW